MSMAKGLLPDTHEQSAAAARCMRSSRPTSCWRRPPQLALVARQARPGASRTQEVHPDRHRTHRDRQQRPSPPVIGDIGSCVSALLAGVDAKWPKPPSAWTDAIAERKAKNLAKMTATLAKNPSPMNFHSALGAIREVVARPDAMIVNEGANTLDSRRHDRHVRAAQAPRRRHLGRDGHRHGLRRRRCRETGKPVIAIEGDSAFGFSAWRSRRSAGTSLPVCVVVFNNNGVYRGTDVNPSGHSDVAPTVFVKGARYDKMMEAFGGVGVNATTPEELTKALNEAIASGKPTSSTR